MDIPGWLKAAREHAGLTQTQIGEIVSVGKANVSAWETGKHQPSHHQLLAISERTKYPLLEHDIANLAWPFSPELRRALIGVHGDALRKAENALRAHMDLPTLLAVDEGKRGNGA